MVLPKVIAERNLNFSLHGVWGDELSHSQDEIDNVFLNVNATDCLTYDTFVSVFIPPKNFIDASPRSNFTCCHGQYHEYVKHGCHQGKTYDEWLSGVHWCIKIYNASALFPHQCRFDDDRDVNVVETGSNIDLGQVGCVSGHTYEFKHFDKCFTTRVSDSLRHFVGQIIVKIIIVVCKWFIN